MNPFGKNFQDGQNPDNSAAETAQIRTESSDERGAGIGPDYNSVTLPEHFPDTPLHKKCALCVHKNSLQFSSELELIIKTWPCLSDEAKGKIRAVISNKEEEK